MRIVALPVAVLGFAVTASGQVRSAGQRGVVYGGSTAITAGDLRHDARTNTVYARGGVRIETPTSTVTAREADIHPIKSTRRFVDPAVDVRGDTRVLITPSAERSPQAPNQPRGSAP